MDVHAVISKIKQLPPTPEILPKLRNLLKDTNSSVNDIISLIKLDQSLSAQIVRVSNGAFYGAQKPSQSLEEAVNRIGFNEVYKLVAFVASSQVLCGDNKLYQFKGNTLWANSVSCATIMQHLAQMIGEDSDTAYTVGLMHAIGKVAINAYYVSNKLPLPTEPLDDDDLEKERSIFGYDHTEAGAALLSHWKFEADITIPIHYQFAPQSSHPHKRITHMLFFAKQAVPLLHCRPQEIAKGIDVAKAVIDEINTTEDELICSIMAAKAVLHDINDLINTI